ncbi:MAG: cob(I)yrinic acid a,c-diamide adenosyltransferase [Elusimicrobia bacterium]|nr:cob(I)yrinic acid a,c-diamide adenosyltransferase [Elusimicrobiota bacterium]
MAARLYTRTGDRGMTGLADGTRLRKDHPVVCAAGDLDELQCCLGLASAFLPAGRRSEGLKRELAAVQEELFTVGAVLAGAKGLARGRKAGALLARGVSRLERGIDSLAAGGRAARGFVLPGGPVPASFLHLARAVCRRAERAAVRLGRAGRIPPPVPAYLNRLSDYLFAAACAVSKT